MNTGQDFNSKYEKETEKYSFDISPSIEIENNTNSSERFSATANAAGELQSTNSHVNETNNTSGNLRLKTSFSTRRNRLKYSRWPQSIRVNYSINVGENNREQSSLSKFVSLLNPAENRTTDRKTVNHSSYTNHSISINNIDIKKMIFGFANLAGIDVDLSNNLSLNTRNHDIEVADMKNVTNKYIYNPYLTNSGTYSTINEMPSMNFRKDFRKGLVNRYAKNLSITLNAQAQFFNQKNVSEHDFQNINRNYKKFIPRAGIRYTNTQFGDYVTSYDLEFDASSGYPNMDQLAPLIDSSDLYNMRIGNPDLEAYDKREVKFRMNHNQLNSKNAFNYGFNLSAGYMKNAIVDSSITDNLGRSRRYSINADGNKYVNASGNLNKAFKFENNQIQLGAVTTFNLSKNPNYVNSILNVSDNFNNYNKLSLHYTFKDILALQISQSYSFYHSKQSGFNNNEFKNSSRATSFSGMVNFTKKISLSSNIDYNISSSSASNDVEFTIWNASANLRFLKANNAELKFSALDILHQNTSIINSGDNNSITLGTVNVLQNYYMVTFSYYPRKFGKSRRSRN